MKENMSRRAFIGSSAVLAGGAALGIAVDRGFRQIGPVDLKICPFMAESRIVQAFLRVDEVRGRFVIKLSGKDAETDEVVVPLHIVKYVVGRMKTMFFCVVVGTDPGANWWIAREDVKNIL